ncbi:hypothetical protein PORY_000353 [Pneumocystis oryctolagi]|uniref:Uncharacterized protein n=1 Tax=Pneumocystis oryctolagi TaxID=42067 RepID=A0ACB7CFQ1_9ASCO|nr:hypothetical protein PORY_000353 [Pneumocystis oryctolagi]
MPQIPLIHFPRKKTDDLDWIQPLKHFIQTTSADKNQYINECLVFNKLRQDIQETNMDLTSRDILYRYYGQLEFLGLRFPIDEKNIRVLFKWYCAFTNKPISQYSLAYEKACVMFNIAATLSAIGVIQDRSEDDGVKKAYHFFQSSAGIFEYINANFLHAPSVDLEKDTIQSLCEIMLAQAQEVLCEKQINKSKKHSMISKLCAQTSWYYEDIVSKISINVQKKIFKKYWLQLCEIKQKFYKSMAHLNKAFVTEENDMYGEALAHLTIAETQCHEASKLSSSLLLSIPNSDKIKFDSMSYFNNIIKNLYIQIQEKKNKLNHDNDYIYHHSIINEKCLKPLEKLSMKNKLNHDNDYIYHHSIINEKCLKPLEKLSMVKATPIQEIYTSQNVRELIGQDIFHNFIPMSIRESISLYSEEKIKLIKKELEKCENADSELTKTLDHLKLPRALELYKHDNSNILKELSKVPEEIIELSKNIFQKENDHKISLLFNNLSNFKEEISKNLNEAEFILEEEERESETMRKKYMHKWTQSPSNSLTGLMKKELALYKENLTSFIKSNSYLVLEYQSFVQEINILIEGEKVIKKVYEQEINKIIYENSNINLLDIDDFSDVERKVNEVEDMLKKLSIIKKQRQTTLEDLKEKVSKDDISNILILKKINPSAEKQFFSSELEKFKHHETRLAETIYHQGQILQNLLSVFKSLQHISSKSPYVQKRTKLNETNINISNNFKETYKKYCNIKSEVLKMISFCENLKELSVLLLTNAKKFVNYRRNEGANILSHIKCIPQINTELLNKQLENLDINNNI